MNFGPPRSVCLSLTNASTTSAPTKAGRSYDDNVIMSAGENLAGEERKRKERLRVERDETKARYTQMK